MRGLQIVNVTLDRTDSNIVEVLQPNPRITNKAIAKRLDIAESTVAQRIRSMAERHVMRVVAQKHMFSDGYTNVVFFFVATSGRTVQRVGADIAKLDGVFGVSQGIGTPDIFATTRVRSMEDAQRLAGEIGRIGGVATVETMPCFRIHKFASTFGDLVNPGRPPVSRSDSRDNRIFHALYRDGRQSNREIARQLDISEGAVRQRLRKLQQSGQMQFQVVCNPLALNLGTTAILRITTDAKETGKIVQRLKNLDAVAFVAEVAGQSNLLALLITPDNLSLGDISDNELLPTRGVRRIDTQILVANIKYEHYLSYFEAPERILRRK